MVGNVRIPYDDQCLVGDLVIPASPSGLVLFAHGSGSSRFSPRNILVAQALQEAGMATLLLDLLTPGEEAHDQTGIYRFDIALLAGRLKAAIAWTDGQPLLRELPLGLFGASTGAASALIAAARLPRRVGAVVSRGGRPDLAGRAALERVEAPTLLIVGERDPVVIDLNREAVESLRCPCELEIVSGASHLFAEPGTLEEVCRLATGWFRRHLVLSALALS